MRSVYIGTSGWSYKGWEKHFYAGNLPRHRQFEFYSTQFPTVEINLTFYRLPTPNMVKGWREKAPEGFVYAVKGSRFITHMKKLTNLDGAVRRYFARIRPLKPLIGVVLWQLPPFLKKDYLRLDGFLKRLPKSYRHAVEFRHPSWLEGDILELLGKHNTAFVSVSSQAMPFNLSVTTDLVYIRFHGLAGGASHDYSRAELQPWAEHIRGNAHAGRIVYAYFNNDLNVRAPANAKLLAEMTGECAVEPFAAAA